MANSRSGLEWSLRNMKSIDTSAQYFVTHYYREETLDTADGEDEAEDKEDQTAYEIFKSQDFQKNGGGGGGAAAAAGRGSRENPANNSIWASLHVPLRTGIVDGKKIVFELNSDVTQRPTESRDSRLKRKHVILNANRSSWEFRARFFLLHFKLTTISVSFLLTFFALNLVFALLFYLLPNGCCADPQMTYMENFAFALQTSSTIGYGAFSASGAGSNFLVLILYYLSTMMTAIFSGLLFAKFATPVINIQFSEVMTIANVNGVPCLCFRLGNADGEENPLTDINVRLTYSYRIPYEDHTGDKKFFQQTEELALLSNRKQGLDDVWTLRHVLDESSPLFGLNFEEHPASHIYVFTLSVDAVQELTKSTVNVQTEYELQGT